MLEPKQPDVPKREPLSRLMVIGFVAMFLAAVAGLSDMILLAVRKVASGQGLQTFRTVWLVEFNYIAFLMLLAAAAIALVVVLFLRWRQEREWKEFEKKYCSPQKPGA